MFKGGIILKATGVVRRIDDLGRIVIPKEIRRTLRIKEGDPLEIFTDKEGEVILKKYSPIGELSEFATRICRNFVENHWAYCLHYRQRLCYSRFSEVQKKIF